MYPNATPAPKEIACPITWMARSCWSPLPKNSNARIVTGIPIAATTRTHCCLFFERQRSVRRSCCFSNRFVWNWNCRSLSASATLRASAATSASLLDAATRFVSSSNALDANPKRPRRSGGYSSCLAGRLLRSSLIYVRLTVTVSTADQDSASRCPNRPHDGSQRKTHNDIPPVRRLLDPRQGTRCNLSPTPPHFLQRRRLRVAMGVWNNAWQH